MKTVQFAAPASEELVAAIRWYEHRRSGLGVEFYDAIVAAVGLIQEHPEIGIARGSGDARHILVRRFPFGIVYRIRPDDLYVVAIAHTSRRPGYWKSRS